jgi:hypothetical protein
MQRLLSLTLLLALVTLDAVAQVSITGLPDQTDTTVYDDRTVIVDTSAARTEDTTIGDIRNEVGTAGADANIQVKRGTAATQMDNTAGNVGAAILAGGDSGNCSCPGATERCPSLDANVSQNQYDPDLSCANSIGFNTAGAYSGGSLNWSSLGLGSYSDATNHASYSIIAGAYDNTVNALAGSITAGAHNYIDRLADHGAIHGGSTNTIIGASSYAVIGGGQYNLTGVGATTADWSVIGGGRANEISASSFGVISGGDDNEITSSGDYNSIGGGINNLISGTASRATVVGGEANTASGAYSVVGGRSNTTSGSNSTAFGYGNTASADNTTAIGVSNVADEPASFAIGREVNTPDADGPEGLFCQSDGQINSLGAGSAQRCRWTDSVRTTSTSAADLGRMLYADPVAITCAIMVTAIQDGAAGSYSARFHAGGVKSGGGNWTWTINPTGSSVEVVDTMAVATVPAMAPNSASLAVRVTPPSATGTHWIASFDCLSVTGS